MTLRRREGGLSDSALPGRLCARPPALDQRGKVDGGGSRLRSRRGSLTFSGGNYGACAVRAGRSRCSGGRVEPRHGASRHTAAPDPEAGVVEVTVENGIPVTTIERVLLDLAARTDSKQLERIFVQAYKTGRLSWPRLDRVLERRRGRKGIGQLRRIAAGSRSAGAGDEIRHRGRLSWRCVAMRASCLPQVNVLVAGSPRRLPLAGAQKVVVETDSWTPPPRSPCLRARPPDATST